VTVAFLVVPLCSKNDLSTFLRQMANSTSAIQGLLHNSGQVGQRPGGRRAVCAMKRVSGSFSLSTTIEIPGEQAPDSGSNESTEKCPVTGRIRFFGSEQYSRKRHQ
jgi:hypothetical protein